MIWILLSVLTSSLLFVIFKKFEVYKVDRFTAVTANYFFAALTGVVFFKIDFGSFLQCIDCLYFISTLGLLFITLFNLLAYVTNKNGATISVLANKMSFLFPVLLSVFFLNEKTSWWSFAAMAVGIVGLYLALLPKKNGTKKVNLTWAILLFIGSGLLDFLLKIGEQFILSTWTTQMLTIGVFISAFVVGLIYGLGSRKLIITKKNILWGFILGIPNFFSIYFLFEAIHTFTEKSTLVFPVNNIGVIICTTIVSIILFKEKLNKINWIGLLLCLLSIILLSILV